MNYSGVVRLIEITKKGEKKLREYAYSTRHGRHQILYNWQEEINNKEGLFATEIIPRLVLDEGEIKVPKKYGKK